MNNPSLIPTTNNLKTPKKSKNKLTPTQIEVYTKNTTMQTHKKVHSAIKLTKYAIKPSRPKIHKSTRGKTHFSTIQAYSNQHLN